MLSSFFTRPRVVQTLRRFRFPVVGRRLTHAYENWIHHELVRTWDQRNSDARQAFERERPGLDPVQQRLVDDLNRHGIARVTFRDLLPEPAYWRQLHSAVLDWLETPEVRNQELAYTGGRTTRAWKEYLVRMYGKDAALPWNSLWLQLALQSRILEVVNCYLGLMSRLLSVDVWDTVPLEHAGPDSGSQRWHRDPEDLKLVKVFLYFTDVDADAGPLEYIKNSATGDRYGHVWPQQLPRGSVPPADDLEKAIPRSQRVECAHPAGTLVFVNTSGLHRGGRARTHRRVLSILTYTSHAVVWPRMYTLRDAPPPQELGTPVRYALFA